MKTLLILAILFSFQFATASISCVIDGTDDSLTLIKGKDMPAQENEDSRAKYEVQLQTSELPFPHTKRDGVTTVSDVFLYFESNDKSISVNLYLDDGNGSATIDGQERDLRDCILIN